MSQLLSAPFEKPEETKTPILANLKSIERRLELEKREEKIRKALSKEKKTKAERGHVLPSSALMETEKRLRKIATRGVVKLFNAIRQAQQENGLMPSHTELKRASLLSQRQKRRESKKKLSATDGLSDVQKKKFEHVSEKRFHDLLNKR